MKNKIAVIKDEENGIVQLFTEDVSSYSRWLKGEDATTCIYRAMDDDRIVGVCLPIKIKEKKR